MRPFGDRNWRDDPLNCLYRVMARRLADLPGTANLANRTMETTWALLQSVGLDPLEEVMWLDSRGEPVQIEVLRRKVEHMETFLAKRTLDGNLTELQVYRQWRAAVENPPEPEQIDDIDDGDHGYDGDAI